MTLLLNFVCSYLAIGCIFGILLFLLATIFIREASFFEIFYCSIAIIVLWFPVLISIVHDYEKLT